MSTFTEQFATEYANNAVPAMLKAITAIKRYNKFVLAGALLTSYLHQAHYLHSIGAGSFAYLVPLIFDAAMVSMLTVVRTPGIARDAKRGALIVFACAALLSATINFAAPGELGLRLIFALVVVLVIGVELVAGRIRPDFAAIEAQAAELLAAANDLKTNHSNENPDASESAPAIMPEPAGTPEPVIAAPVADIPAPLPDVPAHLLPTARFAVMQHEQTTGQPITVNDLAVRMSVTPATAGQLLAAIKPAHPAPARINGAPVLGGAR